MSAGARPWIAAATVVALGVLFRVALAASLPLLEAEAYYWTWSRDLAWGYHDHPPMIAWVIRASTALFGDGVLGIRAGPIALSAAGSLAFFAYCRRQTSPFTALVSTAFLQIAPFWFPFGVLALPDAPLLAFWTLALAAILRASAEDSIARWLLAGALVGLTFLSKYNGAQLPVIVIVFLALHRDGRRQLLRPGPWLALLVAALIATPNLLWVADSRAAALERPFEEGDDLGGPLPRLLSLAVLPFLALTPLLAVAWLRQLGLGLRERRWAVDPRFRLGACAALVPLALFAIVSCVTLVHGHWVATAFVAAVPHTLENLDDWAERRGGPSAAFLRRGLLVAGLLTAVIVGLPAIGASLGDTEAGRQVPPLRRLSTETRGWEELRGRMERELDLAPHDREAFISSRSFHLVGKLEWLTDGRYDALPLRARLLGQFGHRHDAEDFRGRDALFVTKTVRGSTERRLHAAFDSVRRIEPVMIELAGERVIRFELYWCRGFRGLQ